MLCPQSTGERAGHQRNDRVRHTASMTRDPGVTRGGCTWHSSRSAASAFIDESMIQTDGSDRIYSMAAYLCLDAPTALTDEITRQLLPFQRNGQKVHWRDLPDERRLDVCRVLAGAQSLHLIVTTSRTGAMRPERARRLTLRRLLEELATTYGVDLAVLESRGPKADKRDRDLLQSVRPALAAVGAGIRMEHRRGTEAPRLWVPDQVLGADGARRLGRPVYWEALTATGLVSVDRVETRP